MTTIKIDDKLAERIKDFIKNNKIKYPSIKFFADNAIYHELEKLEKKKKWKKIQKN